MNKKLWLAFASFAVVGAVMGAALPASAWSVRQNGAYHGHRRRERLTRR